MCEHSAIYYWTGVFVVRRQDTRVFGLTLHQKKKSEGKRFPQECAFCYFFLLLPVSGTCFCSQPTFEVGRRIIINVQLENVLNLITIF